MRKASQKAREITRLMHRHSVSPLGALDLLLEELRYFEEMDREYERMQDADYPHWLLP